MSFDHAVTIYENMVEMTKKRDGRIRGSVLTPAEVSKTLNHRDYIAIVADREKSDTRTAATLLHVLIVPGSKTMSSKAPLNKMIARMISEFSKNIPVEVVLVSNELMKARLISSVEIDIKGSTVENYSYKLFIIDVTKHHCVPPHSIADRREVEEYCKEYYLSLNSLPKILQTDPQAVWLGVKPGQVVKILRPSESAGYAVAYRQVTS